MGHDSLRKGKEKHVTLCLQVVTDLQSCFSVLFLDGVRPYVWSESSDNALALLFGFLQSYLDGTLERPQPTAAFLRAQGPGYVQPCFQDRQEYAHPTVSSESTESSASLGADIHDLEGLLDENEFQDTLITQTVSAVLAASM